jgi:hypothetical protein
VAAVASAASSSSSSSSRGAERSRRHTSAQACLWTVCSSHESLFCSRRVGQFWGSHAFQRPQGCVLLACCVVG